MAFRQPTYHAPQRTYTPPQEPQSQVQIPASQAQHLADVQEWVLFSPSAASTTDRTYTTTTAQTRTAGHSRISDFGSLRTAARSGEYDEGSEEAIEEGEEDGELDSLDSHLVDFRAEPSVYREGGEASGTVLPTHDGLGSFRIDQTNMGEEVQDHLYAFERYNPRRVKRRRESLELGMLELENERAADAERTRRIENWRLEQSRILVDEIQKETRRRKQSLASERRSIIEAREQEDVATLSNVDTAEVKEVNVEEHETFWNRITRRVIRDLIGIDDEILAIIFGEALPADDDLSTMPPAKKPLDVLKSVVPISQYDESSWEYRLVERIARELGVLVNQLSDHPGAFSTYLHTQQTPLPYAGLPVIPESVRDSTPIVEPQSSVSLLTTSPTDPQFLPTIQTRPISIPLTTTTTLEPSPLEDPDSTPRASNPLTQEEWERDLDIKLVFRYLRSRFTAKFLPNTTVPSTTINFTSHGTSHLATASTADTAARAARVRQHHPLVTRSPGERRRSIEKRTWKVSVPGNGSSVNSSNGGGGGGGGAGAVQKIMRRGSSSCASERVGGKGVGKRASLGTTGSSRHYWDLGGTEVGSGSLIASTGGMGSWGEV